LEKYRFDIGAIQEKMQGKWSFGHREHNIDEYW